ncbi:unnamed protein product, partial [Rotaria sp. Silwood1]
MICDAEQEPCGVGRVFDAQVAIIEHKLIICPGYTAVLRIHATAVEVQLKKLITLIDRKTGERTQKHPRFIKQNQVAIARFELTQSSQTICMEPFKRFPQLGRFTLRDEGRTVVVGKVLKIVDYLLTLKTRNDNLQYRIHIEPRLTPQNIADIESVCSLDYTSSYINWSIVKTTNDKNQFQVKQWNSLEVNLDRKYNFIKAFNQLSDSLSKLPLNDADVLLVEQSIYRYPNLKLATYISQIQQIRAILNTLLHCHSKSKRSVYHISGRDVALHFGLFVDSEMENIVVQQDIAQKKQIVNILFCGHVGCGKKMIQKQLRDGSYKKETEQRTTVGTDRIFFETETKHIISQGQVSFTRENEYGFYEKSTAADVVIFVISATPSQWQYYCEYERFREYPVLAKIAGVRYLVVLINKMDDPTVNWDQAIYEEIKDKLS